MYDLKIEDLFYAYYCTRKNKRNTLGQLEFESNLETNLIDLYNDLVPGNYQLTPCICFIIEDPVKREVFASNFRDRIVHHLIYNYLSPIFEKKFIYDSYSCRKGKGTLFGIKRLEHHLRSCSKNYKEDCYILTLDIQGYFMNINRDILFSKVQEVVIKENVPFDKKLILDLCRDIIQAEPIANCRIKGTISDWDSLPNSKSLFYSAPGCGLPIGNLTSQLFSNIYLNDFDHWIKRECKIKHYGRYVDDFYIIHTDKNYLKTLIPTINQWLKTHLHLTLHPRKIHLQHFSKGVDFLGVHIKPYYRVIGKRCKANLLKTYKALESVKHYDSLSPYLIRATLNSYLGILYHLNSHNLRRSLFKRFQAPYIFGYYKGSRNSYKYVLKK